NKAIGIPQEQFSIEREAVKKNFSDVWRAQAQQDVRQLLQHLCIINELAFVDRKNETKYTSLCPKPHSLLSLHMSLQGERMKQVLIFFSLLVLFAPFVSSQTAQTPPTPPAQTPPPANQTISDVLKWMIGSWEGSGKSRGDHEFLSKLV